MIIGDMDHVAFAVEIIELTVPHSKVGVFTMGKEASVASIVVSIDRTSENTSECITYLDIPSNCNRNLRCIRHISHILHTAKSQEQKMIKFH